jgi:hypothetical protein
VTSRSELESLAVAGLDGRVVMRVTTFSK